MRIGIFGGTFDPIHNCHLIVADRTRRRMRLDRVYFVPSGVPPHKSRRGIQSARDRAEMVRLAVRGKAGLFLSDLEVHRPGKSYAVETVETFRRRFPGSELYFILGIDAFVEIRRWKRPHRLLSLCHFIVLSRLGYSFRSIKPLLSRLGAIKAIRPGDLAALDRARFRKMEIPLGLQSRLVLLKIPPCTVSATQVRKRLSARQDMKNFLPEGVKSFILKKGLYREA